MKWQPWQTVAHDPTYWQNSAEKGLLKAEYLGDYQLRLWFEDDLDVSIYDMDFYPLLFEEDPGPALKPLSQLERFQFVKGDYALIWPNPDTGAYDNEYARYSFSDPYSFPRALTFSSSDTSRYR